MSSIASQKIIKIGRSEQCDIELPEKNVSKNHAILTYINDVEYFLEDLNSTNGTFVNDIRIQKTIIRPNDNVTFSKNGSNYTLMKLLSLKKNNNQIPSDSNDFIVEFQELKKVFEEYPIERKKIIKIEKDVRFYSVVISSSVGVLAFILSFFKSNGSPLFILVSGISSLGISILAPTLASRYLRTDEKLEILDRNYKNKYRCPNPNCHYPFGAKEWVQLAKIKKCPSCKVNWVK